MLVKDLTNHYADQIKARFSGDTLVPVQITADTPAFDEMELRELSKEGVIYSIDPGYYLNNVPLPFSAWQIMRLELQYAGTTAWEQTEFYQKYKDCKQTWNTFTKTATRAFKKAEAKARMVMGGIMRQSKALKDSLNQSNTFYHKNGHVVTIPAQKSASDIYYILKKYYDTDAAIQGLIRLVRTRKGSFVGWTLEAQLPTKHLYTEVLNEWSNPSVETRVVESSELNNEQPGNYACELKERLIDLSKVLDPRIFPVKGGPTLIGALEKVMVLTKNNTSIVIKGAKNLAVIARETGISLAALRHAVHQRSKTANGWKLNVYR